MRKIIIVGASSGIGYEMARLFLERGWSVGLAARRVEPLMNLQSMAPDRVFVREIDVTDVHAAAHLQSLIDEMGGMDVYLHVAGMGKQNKKLDAQIEMQTFLTNGVGFGSLIGTAYRYFATKGKGHIAAVTSIAGTKGLGAAPSYSATKRFQNTYLQALKQLAGMEGVNLKITDIRPGFVDTALLSDAQKYPLLMPVDKVAETAVRAIEHQKRVVVIDWKFAIITFFWKLIPDCIWERLIIRTKTKS